MLLILGNGLRILSPDSGEVWGVGGMGSWGVGELGNVNGHN